MQKAIRFLKSEKSWSQQKMKRSDQYIKIVEWSEEDQCYIGRLPGVCFGGVHGDDEIEVYREICEVLEEWLDRCEKDGQPLPLPTAGRSYSGKFNLRVGEELHEQLALESMKIGESLNQYCVKALKKKVNPA
jgi:predicted HicB family RNase H-like nuclease